MSEKKTGPLTNDYNYRGSFSLVRALTGVLPLKSVIRSGNSINHNYNKILESDWFLARPIFYQIGARAAKVSNNKVSNNKVSNNKVRVLHMLALFIWFLVVTKYFLIFLKPSASRMAFLP